MIQVNRPTDAEGGSDAARTAHQPRRSDRLAGKAAIVFGGGSSGPILSNGQAAAVAYARAGASVTVVDRDLERASATVTLIEQEGLRAVAVQGDVSRETDVERGITAAVQQWSRIDILHNNVGVTSVSATAQVTRADWDRTFAINLTGAFIAIRAVLPIMLRQRSGVITSISSVAAIRYSGIPYASYAASKAALNQLTVSVALEHAADGIRANCILPGMMHTSLVHTELGAFYTDPERAIADRSARCPMGYMGDAWDVANLAVFLASEEARYITAQALVVDGGLSAKCA